MKTDLSIRWLAYGVSLFLVLETGAIAQDPPVEGPDAQPRPEKDPPVGGEPAPATGESTPAAPQGAETAREFPYEATVTATRLNVRAGPSANHSQVYVLEKGDAVEVLAREGDWLRITPPQGCRAWIAAELVEEADGGARVRVTRDDANLRARGSASDGVEVLAQAAQGDLLQVAARHEGWFQVEAPSTVPVWVHGGYVEYQPDRDRIEDVQALEDRLAAELVKPAEEQVVEPILQEARALRETVRDRALRGRLDRLVGTVQQRQEVQTEVSEARDEIEARYQEEMERIQREYRERMSQILRQDRDRRDRAFLMRGWVHGWGQSLTRPGTHRLVQGGRVLAHLRSATLDLNDFYGKYVGVVRGTVTRLPDHPEPLIDVEEVEVLVEDQ